MPHLLLRLPGHTELRPRLSIQRTLMQHMQVFSTAVVPTRQHYSQNKTPKSNRGQRGPEYSFKKKDWLLIYKSSRCTEFSLKKIVIHNKYSTKKSLSYSTSFVSGISKRGMVGWRQEEYGEDRLGEGGKTPCLVPLGDGGSRDLSLSCTNTYRMTQTSARMDGTQVLWDTDLSPCFLIFQALWAPRESRACLKVSPSCERTGQGSMKPSRPDPVLRCYQCVKPVAQSWGTLLCIISLSCPVPGGQCIL